MELDRYIKHDFIREEFLKSCLIISDIDTTELLACSFDIGGKNIIFDNSSIKYLFFRKLKIYYPYIKIINCNSSKKRLLQDLSNITDNLVVFDKIDYCDNFELFENINNIKYRILIC